MATNKLFQGHEADRKAAEKRTADYNRGIADIGTKTSTDKGGSTQRLRDAHTKKQTSK